MTRPRRRFFRMMVWVLILLQSTHSFSILRQDRISTPTQTLLAAGSSVSSPLEYPGRMTVPSPNFRCGFVALIGAPNAGKSTLQNALLDYNLSIASVKPQTTRHAVLGILSTNTTQVCLVDTPGWLPNTAYLLQDKMMEAFTKAYQEAQVIVFVVDAAAAAAAAADDDPTSSMFEFMTPRLLAQSNNNNKPILVALNKWDLVVSNHTDIVSSWRQRLPQATAIVPMSATQGPNDVGVQALRQLLLWNHDEDVDVDRESNNNHKSSSFRLPTNISRMLPNNTTISIGILDEPILPLGPPLYDLDALTDRSERFLASEMIRQALFVSLQQELPYCCQVVVSKFVVPPPPAHSKSSRSNNNNTTHIQASIIVERPSQKGIVIGKGGSQIKQVGILARQRLEEWLETQVHLELSVKVEKDWRKNGGKLKEFGYLS